MKKIVLSIVFVVLVSSGASFARAQSSSTGTIPQYPRIHFPPASATSSKLKVSHPVKSVKKPVKKQTPKQKKNSKPKTTTQKKTK